MPPIIKRWVAPIGGSNQQKSQKPPDHSSTSFPPSSKGRWHRLAVGRLSAAPIVDSQQRQHPLSAPNPSHGAKFFQKVGGTDWRSKGGWHRLSAAGTESRQHRFSTPNSGSTRYRHRTPRMGVSFSKGGWHRLRGGWNAWNAGSDRRPLWMLDATKAPR